MDLFDPLVSFAAGVAVFALTVFGVATLLTGVLPSPVQIATPVGIGTGMAAMTGTYMGLGGDPGSREYRLAFASGAFGVTFVGVFLAAFGSGSRLPVSLSVGTGAGVLAALGVAVVTR